MDHSTTSFLPITYDFWFLAGLNVYICVLLSFNYLAISVRTIIYYSVNFKPLSKKVVLCKVLQCHE